MCSDLDPDPYFKGQGHTHARVRAVTYVHIDGLPANLVQMLNIFITCVFSSKAVKQCYEVTTIYIFHFIENTEGLLLHRCYKSRTHFPSFFSQNNLDINLTYTTHNLNNFNKYLL